MLPTNKTIIDDTLAVNITGNATTADIANTPVISIKSPDNEVAFRMGGKGQNTYRKTINNVKQASIAVFDENYRKLSELPDSDYLATNYYTKAETEALIEQLEKEIIALSNKLNSCYTKEEVDKLIDNGAIENDN